MTKIESLLKKSPIYPALILESYFSANKRRFLIKLTGYLLLSIPIVIIVSVIYSNYAGPSLNTEVNFIIKKLVGLTLLSAFLFAVMQMFEFYFASIFYFEHIAKNIYRTDEIYTFSAGRILRRVKKDNLLTGLLMSRSIGRKIIWRLGISNEDADTLLMKQTEINNPPVFNTERLPLIKIADIITFIYQNHADFRSLLASHGLSQKDLETATSWVIYSIEEKEYHRRWWTRERLARIKGLASDWSFGRTYLLSKYSRELLNDEEVISENISFSSRTRELEQLQSILARSNGANAILVGQPGQEKIEVIWNLCRKIKSQTALGKLVGKRPVLFLTTNFTATTESKEDFEKKLTVVFSEAMQAGNIIMVIDNLPKLIIQAKQFGLNFYELIEPYIASSDDQIIALADTDYFHNLIETDQAIMSRFEVVQTKPLLLDEIEGIISREALEVEKVYEVFYTYPAIAEIAKSAEYYFPDGVSSDKARDLLAELSPWCISNNVQIINKEDVLNYISQKTNIPTGSIQADEKEKLLNLEVLLGKRVVAQTEAIFSISTAVRRGRAGIRNEKRPLGSFLFLGPTGVGKTETAKALAEVFFGDEKLLLRLDMSEYQNSEALARLIGSQATGTQGILANMLREHPYGVLLLDEFEKTNKDVLNLFLQIIDEGYFSDAAGKKVMARNIMFIATSNAGAEKIFDIVSTGKDLKSFEAEIISEIVAKGIFKPELLNRFDATVLFHPLTKGNLAEIALLMLKKVAKKLLEKGMTLNIDKPLVDFVVTSGYNPTFGARPMNRLIQDTVEQHLANLIIRGELNAGQTVTFKILSTGDTKDSLEPVIA
jgi:ATP-dependent Clp protease ATP-binding subunit ClpC